MKNYLANILDNIDVIVYVADIKTYEILYINQYTRKLLGDIKGKICWQSIQKGQTGPCQFCTNDKILDSEGKPIGVYHWEFQNSVTNKWFDIRDSAIEWHDGRIVRLEVATEITSLKNAEEKIRQNAEELTTLLKVSQKISSTLDLEKVLQITINEAVKLTGLGSGAIYLIEGERLHLWATTPPLTPNFPEKFRIAPIADHPHIRQAITTRRSVILDDTVKADLTPAEQAVTKLRGLRTIIYMPLIVEDKVLGVFIVCSIEETVVISDAMINLSVTLANQSALAIQNAQLYKDTQRAYKKLTIKNKELEQVLYVTSHDLRSPLVNVDGFSKELDYSLKELMSSIEHMNDLSSIREKITPIIKEDIPESLHYIQISITKMETLLKGILTLSRVGRYELSYNRK